MNKSEVVGSIEESSELPEISQEDDGWTHNSTDMYQTTNNSSPLVYNKGHITGRCKKIKIWLHD